MTYQIEFSLKAAKQFRALPWDVQLRLQPKIDVLADDPRPAGVIKLEGEESLYRIRIGNYRIVYEIQDQALLVLVVKVGHRRDIYRNSS